MSRRRTVAMEAQTPRGVRLPTSSLTTIATVRQARSYIVYTNPHLTDSADDKHYHLIEKDQVFP